MSAVTEKVAIATDVLELALAAQQATFEQLQVEWQQLHRACREAEKALHASPLYAAWKSLDEQLAHAAVASRQCGERVRELERKLGKTDDYTNGDSHVKVGT